MSSRVLRFPHWDDREALAQALEICKSRHIDYQELLKWPQEEGFEDKLREFKRELQNSQLSTLMILKNYFRFLSCSFM